uniref:Aminoglycoside phosphotransferase n=1 Tax=Streptomyces rimofaciens TaxID=504097 RepID=H9BDW4_9ACTN|nr:aminoglycoside phosphotransferase [Streptomyces rimofaciens]
MTCGEISEVRRVLRRLGDGGPRSVRVRENGNCAVYVGDRLVVRVGHSWPLDARGELHCWSVARDAGVPAPERIDEGRLPGGRTYVAYVYVMGTPAGTPASLAAAGAVLARLHTVPGEHFPAVAHNLPRRRDRYRTAVRCARAAGLAPGGLAHRCLLRAADDWRRSREVAAHGDFRTPNLVVRGRGVRAVLDWSDARAASPESDLGQLGPGQLRPLLRGYLDRARRAPDLELVAGHMLARHLALEAAGVFPAGTSAALARRFGPGLSRGRWTVA